MSDCTHQDGPPIGRDSVEPGFFIRALHVAVLTVLAISVPIFDLIGRQAEFLVAHRARSFEIAVLIGVFYVLLPVAAMAAVRSLERTFPRLRHAFYGIAIGVLTALIALPIIKKALDFGPFGTFVVVGCSGAVAAFSLRFSAVRFFLTLLVPVFLVSPLQFVFFSSASRLVMKGEASSPARSVGNPVPVVVLVFDEFSLPDLMNEDLDIDSDLYPNFSALARSSYWFRNGTTVAQSTRYAVPAILTGQFPNQTRLPIYEDYPDNLFTVLRDDYGIFAMEPLSDMCPESVCIQKRGPSTRLSRVADILLDLRYIYLHIILPESLASRLPTISNMWRDFGRRPSWRQSRAVKAIEFLESVPGSAAASKPSAVFMHTILPHVPWEYLPSGKAYGGDTGFLVFNPGIQKGGRWGNDKWLVDECYQRYLLQLRYIDSLLGRFVDILKQKELYDEALIVVVADHGVSFRPGVHRRQVRSVNLPEIVSVPFFIKVPFQREGEIIEKNVETIDILPTIAAILEIDPPPGPLPGQSIVRSGFAERPKKVILRSAQEVGQSLSFDPLSKEDLTKSVTRRIRLFGSGADPEAIFARGPCPELVGLPVRDLGVEEIDVWLHSSNRYDHVDLQGTAIPARVFGQIRGGRDLGRVSLLAVGINGFVRALARPFAYGKEPTSFSAMIPESSLVDGSNRIQVYDVSGCLPESQRESPVDEIFSSGFESGSLATWYRRLPGVE